MQKSLVVGLIIIMLSTAILPVHSIELQVNEENNYNPIQLNQGNTLYVGGSGPGNYTSIREAVNNSVDGDAVFVYDDSSPYNENVAINKAIFLFG